MLRKIPIIFRTYSLGEFNVNLYLKLSFEFLIIGTPAISRSILWQLGRVLLIERFSCFSSFVKNCINYLFLPTDHRRLAIRILLCFQILDS